MAQLNISKLEDLRRLGKILAISLQKFHLPPLFLKGELGAGKTALVKSIVQNLNGSENAEVNSPSFNIYNLYPCNPPVFHCDLYRCQENFPEDLLDALEYGKEQIIVEWSEFFPSEYYPENFLDISFNLLNNERLLNISAYGNLAQAMLVYLLSEWNKN